MSSMSDVCLHTATFSQLDAKTLYDLLRLRVDVFVVEQDCAYAELDGRDLELTTTHLWLTFRGDERPVAYLRVLADTEGLRIGRVVTVPGRRRTGLAGLLLDAALHTVASDRTVRLHAQLSAVSLYAKRGFVTEGDVFLEDDIRHIAMVRPAAAATGHQERRNAGAR